MVRVVDVTVRGEQFHAVVGNNGFFLQLPKGHPSMGSSRPFRITLRYRDGRTQAI
jgi:hypothetical protein